MPQQPWFSSIASLSRAVGLNGGIIELVLNIFDEESCSMPSEFDRLYLRSIESARDGGAHNVRLDLRGAFGGRHFDC
jgi:hypothetical protein